MRKISSAITIDKSMKVRLLKAIQVGKLDPDEFPEFKIEKDGFLKIMMRRASNNDNKQENE